MVLTNFMGCNTIKTSLYSISKGTLFTCICEQIAARNTRNLDCPIDISRLLRSMYLFALALYLPQPF